MSICRSYIINIYHGKRLFPKIGSSGVPYTVYLLLVLNVVEELVGLGQAGGRVPHGAALLLLKAGHDDELPGDLLPDDEVAVRVAAADLGLVLHLDHPLGLEEAEHG